MSGIRPIFKKELSSYLNSPIAMVISASFALFCAIWFFYVDGFFAKNLASLRSYFAIMPFALSILLPALTMRMWAEERRMGTQELLLTLPVGEWQLVLGKYLASLAVFGFMALCTVFVPIAVSGYGSFDAGQIFGEYLGLCLFGASALAIGQFISALSRNQISAFLGCAGILLALSLLDRALRVIDFPEPLASLFAWFSLGFHFEGFARGLIDTRDAAYFASIAALCLLLTTRSLTERKWK
jgi:ABC-2 type transport system permease protein